MPSEAAWLERCLEATRMLEESGGALIGHLREGSGIPLSASCIWSSVLADGVTKWYASGLAYWESLPPTLSTVLGGYDHVHDADVRDARALIARARAALGAPATAARAIDCGCGIGRIALDVLRHTATRVDVLEPCRRMCDVAAAALRAVGVSGGVHAVGMQDVAALRRVLCDGPPLDIVYISFAIGHLTDADARDALVVVAEALTPRTGVIVVKDNVAEAGSEWSYDTEDESITRGELYFERLWASAGLRVFMDERQSPHGWDPTLVPAHSWVLVPCV